MNPVEVSKSASSPTASIPQSPRIIVDPYLDNIVLLGVGATVVAVVALGALAYLKNMVGKRKIGSTC